MLRTSGGSRAGAAASRPLPIQLSRESDLILSRRIRSTVRSSSIYGCPNIDATHFPYAVARHRWQSSSTGRRGSNGSAKGASGGNENERPGHDERRGMAGAGIGGDRHEPRLLRRVGDAPNALAPRRSRGEADPRAFGEGGGLY